MTAKTGNSASVLAALRATSMPVRYLLGGVLINQMGAFVQTFLVLYLTFHGFSAAQAGITLAAYSIGAVLGTILGGELTHRVGPRTTITAAMTASATVLCLVPVLGRPGLFFVLVAAVACAGLATQSYRPAAAVLLSDLMPEEHRVMGFSMMRIALNAGAAVSPLIAAGLILVSWDLLLWFDGATALIYAILARTLLPKVPAPAAEEKPVEDKRSAYGVLLRDGKYMYFLASVLIGSVIYIQYTVSLPLKITAEHHPTALYSAVLVTASLVLILFELKITSYVTRWPRHVPATAGQALMGVGVAGYGLSSGSVALLIASTVVFVFGIMVSGPTMFAYPTTFPTAVKVRYVGAQQAMFGLGTAMGPLFGVVAWQSLGNDIWWLCGLLGLVAAACALLGMRTKTPAREPAPV
jgi:MFS family permease